MITPLKKYFQKIKPVKGYYTRIKPASDFKQIDESIKRSFSLSNDTTSLFNQLFNYFVEGVSSYRQASHSKVVYPGVPGTRGIDVEGLEGFARTAPMLASWLVGGRSSIIKLNNGTKFDLVTHLKIGLLVGTNSVSPHYWGNMKDYDQRCVEAGDIALTLWLLFEYDHSLLNEIEIRQICDWIEQINHVELYGGNWCLFRLIVNTVISILLGENKEEEITTDYEEFKSYYVGDGWFGDGKNGLLDYYNAWQMQYFLFWFHKMMPNHDTQFLIDVFSEFSKGYQYFISPKGVPIFGRSACYRCAVATPLIINHIINNWSAGKAKRALEVTWKYFIENGALKKGALTQGYFDDFPDLLENYSGRGSALWSLRSLTVAFYNRPDSEFWTCSSEPLPIENSSYKVELKKAKFTLIGDNAIQAITLVKENPPFQQLGRNDYIFKSRSWWRKLIETVFRRPLRLENLGAKYGRIKYESDKPFYL